MMSRKQARWPSADEHFLRLDFSCRDGLCAGVHEGKEKKLAVLPGRWLFVNGLDTNIAEDDTQTLLLRYELRRHLSVQAKEHIVVCTSRKERQLRSTATC
ncbi:hypothetical protein HPB48_003839 [Haemaphysalis longicornis]|uniref:Uncharacterized protein n=1 Tax=Haemaphysalis longicornis TaxID=44386 RepID=A0A9J6FBI1_HAELO|nr:hypothetical protein HPB48_003839 [Haemaphysalis longicornis]